MLMKCIGSGSKGNGYVLKCEDETLLIECGVPIKKTLQAINYRTRNIAGCLVTHEHGDHANNIKSIMQYGIKTYASDEVSTELEKVYGEKVIGLPRMTMTELGGFSVIPFGVPHNDTECDGFLILHKEFGKLLFMTDAEYCPYNFRNLEINHVMVECNYSEDYIDSNFDLETTGHVFRGHMELQTCKRFIKTINSQNLRSVGLLHLSGRNGHPTRFQEEVKELVDSDVNVWVAGSGTEIDLNLQPF